MIQEPSKDLTLIVYNTPKPPKYIQINKGMLKTLLFAIPALIVVSIAFTLFTSFFMKRKLEAVRSKEPQMILDLKQQTLKLSAKIESLELSNKELTQKIAQGPQAVGTASSLLALIKTPLGFEDYQDKKMARVENFSHQTSSNKVVFKFDLINNLNGDERLSGYITVVQFHSYGTNFYPNLSLNSDSQFIQYNKGESFTVSRFRPVIAEFPLPANSANVWYKVYIFSREGNLLSINSTKEFPLN